MSCFSLGLAVKKGDLAIQVLDALIEPKTLQDLIRLLKVHRNVVISITKDLIRNGFVTILKTVKSAS